MAAVAWTLRALHLVGVVLMPVVCVAHATATLRVFRNTSEAVRLLLLLPFLITLALLACAALLLWCVINADDGYDAGLVVALGGLMFCYLFTFMGAGEWMLRWQGTETTCTVLGIEERQDLVPVFSEASGGQAGEGTRYDYEMECAVADAPDEMTPVTRAWEVGERVAVVYDPSTAWGTWGARPAEEWELGNNTIGTSALFVSASTAVWTVPTLGCALVRLRRA
jgi:hypothetical protein